MTITSCLGLHLKCYLETQICEPAYAGVSLVLVERFVLVIKPNTGMRTTNYAVCLVHVAHYKWPVTKNTNPKKRTGRSQILI